MAMNKKLKMAIAAVVMSAAGLVGTQAIAATADGTLAATSTGTVDVTLTISELFQISNISAANFTFGTFSGSGAFQANEDICVYSNGDGSYKLTGTDDSTGATFAVENAGDSEIIAMTVNWNDVGGTTTGNIALVHGTATVAQSGADVLATDCTTAGDTGNLEVIIAEAALLAAGVGSYDSEITLVVEAD